MVRHHAWTVYALILAEELAHPGQCRSVLDTRTPTIRRLLGVTGDHGPPWGLGPPLAYNAIKAVGNYGEIFERHLGPNSPIAWSAA